MFEADLRENTVLNQQVDRDLVKILIKYFAYTERWSHHSNYKEHKIISD